MAENNKKSIKNVEATKDDLPSSEDIVDSLVKEFKGDAVKIDDTTEKVVKADLTNNSNPLDSDGNDKANTSSELLNSENDEDDSDTKESEPAVEDDFIDEDHLKDLEVDYSEDQKLKLKSEAEELKNDGNNNFKAGEFREAAHSYTKALRICPLAFDKDRAIMYANRAAAKVKLSLNETAIEDCTKAVELDPQYLKAFLRRAQLYEKTDKLDEALADYNKILEIDPLHRDALFASKRLPEQINERNEKLKTEMLGKLKDLGNMFLKPFGLSTNNFQMVQDPNSGGYSINFNSNANQS